MADFQMSFPVEALLARGGDASTMPNLAAYRARIAARPGYQRAIDKGGPILIAS
jgi:glutathione S-transferase